MPERPEYVVQLDATCGIRVKVRFGIGHGVVQARFLVPAALPFEITVASNRDPPYGTFNTIGSTVGSTGDGNRQLQFCAKRIW